MNALKLGLFDSVVPFAAADFPAVGPRVQRTGVAPLKNQPASLWRESLAAHEPAGRVRWSARGGFALLGAMSLASVGYALVAVGQGVLAQDGLRATVGSLLGR